MSNRLLLGNYALATAYANGIASPVGVTIGGTGYGEGTPGPLDSLSWPTYWADTNGLVQVTNTGANPISVSFDFVFYYSGRLGTTAPDSEISGVWFEWVVGTQLFLNGQAVSPFAYFYRKEDVLTNHIYSNPLGHYEGVWRGRTSRPGTCLATISAGAPSLFLNRLPCSCSVPDWRPSVGSEG